MKDLQIDLAKHSVRIRMCADALQQAIRQGRMTPERWSHLDHVARELFGAVVELQATVQLSKPE